MDSETTRQVSLAVAKLAEAAEQTRRYGWAQPIPYTSETADAVRCLFGGAELVASSFPLLDDAIKRTMGRRPWEDGPEEPQCYCTVRDMEVVPEAVSVAVDVSLNLVPERLFVTIVVSRNGEAVSVRHYPFARLAAFSETVRVALEPLADEDVVEAALIVTWDNGGGYLSTCFDCERASVQAVDPVAGVHMAHPVLRWPNSTPTVIREGHPNFDMEWPSAPVQEHDATNVCFLRWPKEEPIDYTYPEMREPGQPQPMQLDIRGEVTLLPDRTFSEVTSATIGLIKPTPEPGRAGGGVPYRIDITNAYFKASGNTFLFALPTAWGSTIEDSVIAGDRAYDIDIDIQFATNRGNGRLSITSKDPAAVEGAAPSPHYSRIPPVRLFWGCLEASTRVRMEDGTERVIADVQIGDRLATGRGSAAVRDIILGRESELIRIETFEGDALEATGVHPVLVDGDAKRADAVTVDDRISTDFSGGYRTVCCHYPISGAFEVVNLVLEGAETFIANGMLVGDNETQGRLQREQATDLQAVQPDEAVLRELERMRDELGKLF